MIKRINAWLFGAIFLLPSLALGQNQPNILVLWGDDIGAWNISHNNRGMMGYRTPSIDRIAREGLSFTDYYICRRCTASMSFSAISIT